MYERKRGVSVYSCVLFARKHEYTAIAKKWCASAARVRATHKIGPLMLVKWYRQSSVNSELLSD